jgi:hypothetical protein
MTKSQIFKTKFPDFVGAVDAYKNNSGGSTYEILNFIDVPNNRINYTYFFVAECGCCDDSDSDTETMDFVLDDMSDADFEELCEEVEKLQKD